VQCDTGLILKLPRDQELSPGDGCSEKIAEAEQVQAADQPAGEQHQQPVGAEPGEREDRLETLFTTGSHDFGA
jgi:hypothetical protein